MVRVGFSKSFISGINRPRHHLHRTAQPPTPNIGPNVARWIQRSPDDHLKQLIDSVKSSNAASVK
ncbi:hypothetical protein BATDEDRAFT_87101 [Batrachochytrium dendrobatidis JAM81]|uniref:Uncharacterized protein n=1 Tax=Batrachochytrium dendrobatidis (strain JAM81 / FGSC 10211) TaxID=684364 RepID=F4NXP6_BATDJ|nr:uncharacterized protein BATDEDRAFT_87101 [Batrachochytrium dendrobatidis JAM81]EGF82178.1 hypothetical protein BATDEDRAFT_87101 [Batrachochytrium dendrobatidis JAM81]KAJ8324552.1 hypothetical protein O5D80_006797 [Batrachochytrium dendrobatidis]KAK5670799.1 hypothetical protein QVD99_002569 [Batrachochytrium dendrobatidis]|eukprot:XP_006677659.1 hypothetical protein BATDEDRAFT_87101 [Batrachochytrium dendrobatidis JAM81]